MASQGPHMWSLRCLVAAFLDLSIAYLLLCASAVAYLASKFLGFFGLYLPCPCEGLFFTPHSKNYCMNRLLIDYPTQKVSNVQLSVKQKFPFNYSVWSKNSNYHNGGNEILELEGEASCSSVSDARRSFDLLRRDSTARADKYDMKGKGVVSHRPRSRLRQHRRVGGGHGKYSSVSSFDPPLREEATSEAAYSQCSTNEGGNGFVGGGSLPINDADAHNLECDTKTPEMHIKKNIPYNEPPQDIALSEDEKIALRLLEQALEEERAAHAALYVELEKERSAAASAADEAMAMILRLQEEKASIEMEARQYHRIIEEKSAYDAEEMEILKEILVRREKEKHFLEKEVEAYRQIVSVGNEQFAGDGSYKSDARQIFGLSLDPNEDPVLLLQQLNASAEKKAMMKKSSEGGVSMDEPKLAFGSEYPIQCLDGVPQFEKQGDSSEQSARISVCNNAGRIDLQEKEIISVDNNLELTSRSPQERKEATPLDAKELEQIQEANTGHKMAEKIIVTCDGADTAESSDVSKSEQFSAGSSSNVRERNYIPFEASVTKRMNTTNDRSRTEGPETEASVRRSSSEITYGLPPIAPRTSRKLSELRRRSMSALDTEMLKLDSEVGWLLERLRLVQEEKEKLSFSVENRERENIQLKLLEDIAHQIQEIRHLNEPEKAVRRMSLPLPTSQLQGLRWPRR